MIVKPRPKTVDLIRGWIHFSTLNGHLYYVINLWDNKIDNVVIVSQGLVADDKMLKILLNAKRYPI